MDWIDLSQDRDRWRTFLKAVMKHRVPQSSKISRPLEVLLGSPEGLSSMEIAMET
jgi:hypothetical protein